MARSDGLGGSFDCPPVSRSRTQRTEAETGSSRARVRLGEGFRKDKGPPGSETERLFVSVHGGGRLGANRVSV
ncbi:hypothetical protein MTO96_012141 [Rhipicephalus appendiculatus]